MSRRPALAATAIVLTACPAPPPPSAPPPATATTLAPRPASPRPRLVVLVVIDQLPAWAFAEKRPHLTAGFDRLLREGAWHTGEHPSAATLTAPGHALLGSGEPPAASGILGNDWWRRDLDRKLASTEGLDGTASARWLRAPALGDAVAAAGTGARAVSVALKDRAAILTLGRAGTPIWYDRKAVAWTTTSPPAWLAAHTAAHPIRARLGEVWTPLDPARLARLSGTTDDQPGEVGEKGLGPTFPHALGATKHPATAVLASPLGNALVLETGLAAIDGERLGADDVPDLLVVSLSAYDYAAHGWGHESWELWDMTLRLDQQLAAFLTGLDTRVGAGRWALVLTSDHGGSPLAARVGGGHLTHEEVAEAANRAAVTALGPGTWIAAAKYPTLYLSAAARAKPKDHAKVLTKIIYALRSFPGIARVERTADVAGDCEQRTGELRAMCLALDPEASGEVVYLPRRGWSFVARSEPVATAHGSLHDYDREVPVIVLAPGRVPHPPLAAPAATKLPMTEIAPLLADWLGVAAPSTLPRP